MVVSASPDAQKYPSLMRKRTAHTYGREWQQPGPKLALRANSSHTSTTTSTATSTETPSPTSTTSNASSISATPIPASTPISTSSSTTPSPSFATSSAPTSSTSTSTSTISTTSTLTPSLALPPSISTIQPSRSTLSTSSTSSVPVAVTTIALPQPTTYPSTFGQLPQTSTSAVSAAQASTSASPKSFFANTGAVAGTFTVVGLAVAGLWVTLFICLCKRHRTPEDGDDALFEKIPVPASYHDSGGTMGLGSLPPVYPPVTNAYADEGYAHATNVRNGDYNHQAGQYGMEYPPGTIYTTQQYQQQYEHAANASWAPRPISPTARSLPHANPFDTSAPMEAHAPDPLPVDIRSSSIAYGVPHESQDSFYGARD